MLANTLSVFRPAQLSRECFPFTRHRSAPRVALGDTSLGVFSFPVPHFPHSVDFSSPPVWTFLILHVQCRPPVSASRCRCLTEGSEREAGPGSGLGEPFGGGVECFQGFAVGFWSYLGQCCWSHLWSPVSRALWAAWHLPGSKDGQERPGVQHRHPGESCLESYPFSRKMAKPLGPLLRF